MDSLSLSVCKGNLDGVRRLELLMGPAVAHWFSSQKSSLSGLSRGPLRQPESLQLPLTIDSLCPELGRQQAESEYDRANET